jgi:hypothetical protein
MMMRRQRLLVTSAAVLGTFFGAVAMTAPAMAGTHPATAKAPAATGTNIGVFGPDNGRCRTHSPTWDYCLYYQQNQGGAYWGSTQQTFRTIIASYPYNGTGGGKPVRNDAASMMDNTQTCNVTTWVSPGYVGDYNWLFPTFWGNLTPTLHNNEASISYNNCM